MAVNERRIFVRSGHELLARGAVHAGCQFFVGSAAPAVAGLADAMMKGLVPRRGIALVAPDEATTAAYAVGASARGAKAMAATAGPSWTRMVDMIEYAVATELPLVVAVVEQLGPTSCGEQQGAQGDILVAEYCISGGYTLPVFTPSTAPDCYEVATAAFYWSERIRGPVVVLCDSTVAGLLEDVDEDALTSYPPGDRPRRTEANGTLRPYEFDARDEVPVFWGVGDRWRCTLTASPHDKGGRSARHGEERVEVLRHLEDKVAARADEMAMVRVEGDADADTIVVAFGSTARTAHDAVQLAHEHDRRLAVATVLSLFPVPAERLLAVARHATTIIVAEENLSGQYRRVIEPLLAGKRVFGVNAVGQKITPQQILEGVEESEWKAQYV
jgi:2-oxoglutarate ferredoxin oxidoreductase subunit alpha